MDMEYPAYKFEVGDRVLCSTNELRNPSLPGTVIECRPKGGGNDGRDPLYVVLLDSPLGSHFNDFFSYYSCESRVINYHGQYLRLVERSAEPEDCPLDGLMALL